MFELSFNLDLSKPKFVHEILALRVQTRIDGGNIPSPRIGLVWGNPEILGHTWSLRPNILFCIILKLWIVSALNTIFFLVTLPCNKNSISSKKTPWDIFAMMILRWIFGISVVKPPVEKPGVPGSTTGLSGACEMQVLAPEAVAGRPPRVLSCGWQVGVGAVGVLFFFWPEKMGKVGLVVYTQILNVWHIYLLVG